VQLHTDLVMLVRLGQALSRAQERTARGVTRYHPVYLHSSFFPPGCTLTTSHCVGESGNEDAVSDVVTLRFPGRGASEYRLSETTPKVGDVLKRNGDTWIVTTVEKAKDGTAVVTLRAGPKPLE
jgi:hypothetical protein